MTYMTDVENSYECAECHLAWFDTWECSCNDRCPGCGAEIEPWLSEPIDGKGDNDEGQ